jgi:hypothetical protein
MKKLLYLLLCPFISPAVYAQEFLEIRPVTGRQQLGEHTIKVEAIGNPYTDKGGICGVNGYWIGYQQKNGFRFSFIDAVPAIRIRLAAMQSSEQLSIYINDEPYQVRESDISVFEGSCQNHNKATAKDGLVTSNYEYANGEINIRNNTGIRSVELKHLNGTGAGTVFDIAIPAANNTANGHNTTGLINSILQPGMFNLLPNPANNVARLTFLSTSTGTAFVTITDAVGRKIQSQTLDCTKGVIAGLELNVSQLVPGNYMVEVKLNESARVEKLVKL